MLFDGTHYNLCVFRESQQLIDGDSKFSKSGGEMAKFDVWDERAYQGCLELAKECKSKNEDIDPAIFSLVCYECSRGLIG